MGLSENGVPLNPMVNDHYPYKMAIIGIPHFQTYPYKSFYHSQSDEVVPPGSWSERLSWMDSMLGLKHWATLAWWCLVSTYWYYIYYIDFHLSYIYNITYYKILCQPPAPIPSSRTTKLFTAFSSGANLCTSSSPFSNNYEEISESKCPSIIIFHDPLDSSWKYHDVSIYQHLISSYIIVHITLDNTI